MKTPLILLHGALGAADQMLPLKSLLGTGFSQILAPDLVGHGFSAADFQPFSIGRFAEALSAFLEKNGIGEADFFGYSMGGYVALELARARPKMVRRVATLGTKFDWTPESAAQTAATLDPEKWLAKAPTFVEILQKRHSPENWLAVVDRTKKMMAQLGAGQALTTEHLASIHCPVLVTVGSLDTTVSEAESKMAAERLRFGQFLPVLGAKHPFEQVDLAQLAVLLTDFFQN